VAQDVIQQVPLEQEAEVPGVPGVVAPEEEQTKTDSRLPLIQVGEVVALTLGLYQDMRVVPVAQVSSY
jgi:hypothetical protein